MISFEQIDKFFTRIGDFLRGIHNPRIGEKVEVEQRKGVIKAIKAGSRFGGYYETYRRCTVEFEDGSRKEYQETELKYLEL